MKQLITLLFMMVLLSACTKEEVNQIKTETITTSKNLKIESFAKAKLNATDFENYDFSKVLAIVKYDTLRGWQINAKAQSVQQFDFLIINALNGEPISIYRNSIKYEDGNGTRIPVKLTNTDMLTGKLKNYDLHPKEIEANNNGIRKIEKMSQTTPVTTLPPVVVVGH